MFRSVPTEKMNGVTMHGKLHYCSLTGKTPSMSKDKCIKTFRTAVKTDELQEYIFGQALSAYQKKLEELPKPPEGYYYGWGMPRYEMGKDEITVTAEIVLRKYETQV